MGCRSTVRWWLPKWAFLSSMAVSPRLSMNFLHLYALIVNEDRATDSPWFSFQCNMAQQVPPERWPGTSFEWADMQLKTKHLQ